MQIRPEVIREQTFRVRLKGFDREEVQSFLATAAEALDEALDENRLLKGELESLHAKQKDLEELFLQAKRFSDQKFTQANLDAERIQAEAQLKADAIQEKAQAILDRAEQEARDREETIRQKGRDILFELEKDKVTVERQIVELRTKKASLFAELKGLLEAYQTWLKEMGDVDPHQG